MSRLTLRLPSSMHQLLEERAQEEGVSMNQFIVYALARQLTGNNLVQAVPERVVAEQRAHYRTLLDTLGRASHADIRKAMDERDPADPEVSLTSDVVAKIRDRLEGRST
jgi:uncharacterized protein (DUF1778 family)